MQCILIIYRYAFIYNYKLPIVLFVGQHLTFDKGGKCIGNFRGIVRFWEGWCGASGGSAFKRAVGVTVFGATGGASSLPYEKRW